MMTPPSSPAAAETLILTHEVESAYDVVDNWHQEHHTGRLEHCHEQPCKAVAVVGR